MDQYSLELCLVDLFRRCNASLAGKIFKIQAETANNVLHPLFSCYSITTNLFSTNFFSEITGNIICESNTN